MKRISLALDEILLAEAIAAIGARTEKEAVEAVRNPGTPYLFAQAAGSKDK